MIVCEYFDKFYFKVDNIQFFTGKHLFIFRKTDIVHINQFAFEWSEIV